MPSGEINARKTHCIRGHEFNERNTYRTHGGTRGCKACRVIHSQKDRDRRAKLPKLDLKEKTCSRCGLEKKIDSFSKNKSSLDGRVNACKVCTTELRLLREYGISEEEYQKRWKAQQGLCGICKRPERERCYRLAVDHDHATGEIRGLLCRTCNTAIGQLETVENLEAAAAWVSNGGIQ